MELVGLDQGPVKAFAAYAGDFMAHAAPEPDILVFPKGAVIHVVEGVTASGWMKGTYNGTTGWFPQTHTRACD